MKRGIIITISFLLLSATGYSQCTPNAPTGNPGLSPAPSSVTCIERGVPYDFILHFENFTSFNCSGFSADVNFSRIDNLANLPCGITWQPDQTSYAAGETGCIRITGTSTDVLGQYPLEVFMTVELDIFGTSYTVNGSLNQLEQQLQQAGCSSTGVNTAYYSRVINPGNTCPAIGSSSNLTSSGATCPPPQAISVSISGNTTICNGSSTTLTANVSNATGAVTYSWSSGGGSGQTVNVSPTATTPYSVTVTDQNGSATASATVTVNQVPNAAFTASVNGATVTTSNSTTGATSYSWNFGDGTAFSTQQNPIHTYTANGTYTITLTATNNCGSSTATQQVTVTAISGLSVTISGNATICPGSSTTLTANPSNASGSVSYSWSPSGGSNQTATVSPTANTTYTVVANDQNGSATDSHTVTVNPLPVASFTYTVQGFTVTFTSTSANATSYLWEFGPGGGTSTQEDPTHTFPAPGQYDVTLTATNSCGNDIDSEADVIITTTGIHSSSPGFIDIYPNPTSGTFEVSLNNISGSFLMNIFDLSGKNHYSEVFTTASGNNIILKEMSGLSKGIYIFSLSSEEISINKKLVIY